ncbi:hypothetical protein MASR1M48_17270 [Lactococcus petauri]
MLNFLKKLFGIGSKKGSSNEKAPAVSHEKVELAMDLFVKEHLSNYPNLLKFKNDLSFWQNHFKALAFAESTFNQVERYEEDLGIDKVTGKKNTSEGYFQMSYQDSLLHGCPFDWSADKAKDAKDKTKTIFNLERNLECAMILTNKQLAVRGMLFTKGKPYYWSVLDQDNPRHAVYLKQLNLYKQTNSMPAPAPVEPVKTEVIVVPQSSSSKIKKIAVIIGHGHGDSGATGNGTTEFEYHSKVAKGLQALCPTKEIKLFFRDGRGIGGVNADAEKWGGDLTLELHLNSFNGKAKGCEVLVLSKDEVSIKMGQNFADLFCSTYNRIKRDMDGVKELKKGDRGHYSLLLVDDPAPSILIEPFFIDNPAEFIQPEEFLRFLANWINKL